MQGNQEKVNSTQDTKKQIRSAILIVIGLCLTVAVLTGALFIVKNPGSILGERVKESFEKGISESKKALAFLGAEVNSEIKTIDEDTGDISVKYGFKITDSYNTATFNMQGKTTSEVGIFTAKVGYSGNYDLVIEEKNNGPLKINGDMKAYCDKSFVCIFTVTANPIDLTINNYQTSTEIKTKEYGFFGTYNIQTKALKGKYIIDGVEASSQHSHLNIMAKTIFGSISGDFKVIKTESKFPDIYLTQKVKDYSTIITMDDNGLSVKKEISRNSFKESNFKLDLKNIPNGNHTITGIYKVNDLFTYMESLPEPVKLEEIGGKITIKDFSLKGLEKAFIEKIFDDRKIVKMVFNENSSVDLENLNIIALKDKDKVEAEVNGSLTFKGISNQKKRFKAQINGEAFIDKGMADLNPIAADGINSLVSMGFIVDKNNKHYIKFHSKEGDLYANDQIIR